MSMNSFTKLYKNNGPRDSVTGTWANHYDDIMKKRI